MGLNLGVVILLRSLIPLSLVVISCFFGEGLCRKELRGFTPAIQAKASTALSSSGRNRADGAILGPSGDAKMRVYVGFTSDFFRRHSFSYVGHFLGLSLSISENSSLRWGQLKRGHTHTLALALR